MKRIIFSIILLMYIKCSTCEKYNNYTLFRCVPVTSGQFDFLKNLTRYYEIDFWRYPGQLNKPVEFTVSPEEKDLIINKTNILQLNLTTLMTDVQRAFDEQKVGQYLRQRPESFDWKNYYSLDDIYNWLNDTARKYPKEVELQSIGKSAEGREIYALAIKKQKSSTGDVIVEGGIHGHEWISPAFVTYLIYSLINIDETNSNDFKTVARTHHWYLIPVVNPDGYAFTHKQDRMWRKNRRPSAHGAVGVDLNRNFDYKFGSFASSKEPDDNNYCGSKPFSEPETQALSDFVHEKRANLKYYFAIHGYGQKIIIPYGDKKQHIENYSEMENYARQSIMKMYSLYNVKYSVGNALDTLGLRITGDSASWVKYNFKVPYVYTLLLRDNGTYGFALPPSLILPTCEEALIGITELMSTNVKFITTDFFDSATTVEAKMTVMLCLLAFFLIFN